MAAIRTPACFTVGWVCALPIELAAAQELMDEEYEDLPQPPADTNIYSYGRVGEHNVVAACLPAGQMGNNSAAVVATQMRTSFHSLRFGLLVGIGGGVPNDEHDIRLGDVVISQPAGLHGGVVQFDFGKAGSGGEVTRTGSLNAPPTILLNALAKLRANVLRGRVRVNNQLSAFSVLPSFACPGPDQDVLYAALSRHVPGLTCAQCKKDDIILRQPRATSEPVLFFGTIASGNQVMKDAPTRDRINQSLGGGVLCFEMEAAGLMNNFPCLVVRGICDYADAHKNKQWQPYAATTAAAYTKELLQIIPPVVTLPETSQISELTSQVQHSMPLLLKEQIDCLRSLGFPEQESRYQDIHSAKHTCQWLLEDAQYLAWTKKPRGLFWVKGNPGAGKSVLLKFAYTAMEHDRPRSIVLSFFFNARGTSLQKSPLGAFRALLNSMLEYFPQFLSQLTKRFGDREKRYGSYQDGRWTWAAEELRDFMSEVLSKGTKDMPVIIFIDALDECGEHDAKVMLEYFRDLIEKVECTGGNLKVCFSSRHYPILGLNTIPAVSVEDRNHTDIRLIVRERLKRIEPEDRRRNFEEKILLKSRGGFQWAVLVTARVLDGNAKGIKEAMLLAMLTDIPETLDELYEDILSGSTGEDKVGMVKIFQWILVAKRPLSSQELREALATDPDMTHTTVSHVRNHDNWVESLSQFEKYVTHVSRGLVEFQTRELWEDYEPGGESWDREAQFIHQSVADYTLQKFLCDDNSHQNASSDLLGAGHFMISRSCLKYVTLGDVLDSAVLPRGTLCARYPLVSYAIQFLLYHIRKVDEAGIPQLDLLTLIQWNQEGEYLQRIGRLWRVLDHDYAYAPKGFPFVGATILHVLIAFGSKNAFDAVLNDHYSEIDIKDSNGYTPLLLAIECHSGIALTLLDRFTERQPPIIVSSQDTTLGQTSSDRTGNNIDVNVENNNGDTPLILALDEGNEELVLRLIEAGADPMAQDSTGRLAAHAAATNGYCEVIKVLIAKGVEVTVQDDSGTTALHSASSNGYVDVARLLLEKDADPNAGSDEDGQTPLGLASAAGHLDVARLLLENGADPNAGSDRYGRTPLGLASAAGHLDIARFLLEKGANPNAGSDEDGRTPLGLASAAGHLNVARLLLENGADPNAGSDRYGRTPLDLASAAGHLDIARFLLEKGANPNAGSDEDGRTPLGLASAAGHLNVARLLLENGADPNAGSDEDGQTPLGLASAAGHLDVARLLLEKAADVNVQGGVFGNALHAASAGGYREIVQLLLDKAADVNAQGGEYGNALQAAIIKGHWEIAQMLIENGANVNARDAYLLIENGADVNSRAGQFVLYMASSEGDQKRVQKLVDKGIIINSRGGHYGNVLYTASSRGYGEMVQILVNNKADVNAQNRWYGNALYAASSRGYHEIVQILVNNGADVNAQGGRYDKALQAASFVGYQGIVQILIDNGADINAQGGEYGNALQAALLGGHRRIARILIYNGANVNAQNIWYGNALYTASLRGYRETVQMLVEKGANVNIHSGSYGNALQAATSKGYQEIVRILIQSGADVDSRGGEYGCAIQAASSKGYQGIVQILIDNGADVNAKGGHYGNALQAASSRGHQEIVQLLLDNGANVNAEGRCHGNAPYAASEKGLRDNVMLITNITKNHDPINSERLMSSFSAINADQKESEGIQMQSSKRKYIELSQKSTTKKPCI